MIPCVLLLLISLAYGVLAVVYLEHACRLSGQRFTWSDAGWILLLSGLLWPLVTTGLLLCAWELYQWRIEQ